MLRGKKDRIHDQKNDYNYSLCSDGSEEGVTVLPDSEFYQKDVDMTNCISVSDVETTQEDLDIIISEKEKVDHNLIQGDARQNLESICPAKLSNKVLFASFRVSVADQCVENTRRSCMTRFNVRAIKDLGKRYVQNTSISPSGDMDGNEKKLKHTSISPIRKLDGGPEKEFFENGVVTIDYPDENKLISYKKGGYISRIRNRRNVYDEKFRTDVLEYHKINGLFKTAHTFNINISLINQWIKNGVKSKHCNKEFKHQAINSCKTHGIDATSRSFEVTKGSLYRWLREEEVDLSEIPRTRHQYSDQFKKEVSDFKKDHSMKKTVKQFGVPESVVYKWCVEFNRDSKTPQSMKQNIIKSTKQDIL